MPGHIQGTNRGVQHVGTVATMTGLTVTNSSVSFTVQPNSTGMKFGDSNPSTLGVNSTGFVMTGGLKIKNTTGQIVVNSTGVKLGNKVEIGPKATLFSSNTTGVKLGNKYISGNSTGN